MDSHLTHTVSEHVKPSIRAQSAVREGWIRASARCPTSRVRAKTHQAPWKRGFVPRIPNGGSSTCSVRPDSSSPVKGLRSDGAADGFFEWRTTGGLEGYVASEGRRGSSVRILKPRHGRFSTRCWKPLAEACRELHRNRPAWTASMPSTERSWPLRRRGCWDAR